MRFPSCERWNALVFRPHVVFIIITSGWPGNDETVTLKISPHLNFSCIFIFLFKTVFTKIPKEGIFPPIFPVIFMHLGTYIQRFREGYRWTVRTSYIQCVNLFSYSVSLSRSLPKLTSGLLLLLLAICGAGVRFHDGDFSPSGYRWLALHCAAAAAADAISSFASSSSSSSSTSSASSSLSPREKALVKNGGCFLLLTVGSTLSSLLIFCAFAVCETYHSFPPACPSSSPTFCSCLLSCSDP